MEALSRQEYPAMLSNLLPAQAVGLLNDRVKRIGIVNREIATWFEERYKIEEIYSQGLQKLARRIPPDNQSELGVFTTPWQKIVGSTETISQSHHTFATRLQKDVIDALNQFVSKNREMQAMGTIQGNLGAMAKELEEARKVAEKVNKKSGKGNSGKAENAAQKLEAASQQWDSQAPFVFEKLQSVDETRLNHLRDILTQFQTHEADQVERSRANAEATLNAILEVDTSVEIFNFTSNAVKGKPKLEKTPLRRNSSNTPSSSLAVPAARPSNEDAASLHSSRNEPAFAEPKGLKRLGTMLGRRRQSIHGTGGFVRAPSPSKSFGPFGRNTGSRDGRPTPSPRASSNNLRESPQRDNRLSMLPESPKSPSKNQGTLPGREMLNGGTNGNSIVEESDHPQTNGGSSKELPDLSGVQSPPGPPPSQQKSIAPLLDSEGFTVRTDAQDPISMAQMEASDSSDAAGFKLAIKSEPIQEEDDDAQNALSKVANTLRSSSLAATPSRKAGTVRGRRDVRNTIYIPAPEVPTHEEPSSQAPNQTSDAAGPITPSLPTSGSSRIIALAAMSQEGSSDSHSIRSARSLTSGSAIRHPELSGPGLNASIIETVNAYVENGEIQNVTVIGELALAHGADQSGSTTSSGKETIRLTNFPALEAIAPNHAFISELSSETPGEYTVDLSHVSKTVVAFRYKVHMDSENVAAHVPLIVKPSWRLQGDKLGLVIEYKLNSSFASMPIQLHSVVLLANYEGGKASNCQTKPTGTHLKEKSLIYWRIGDVTLDHNMQKVVARLTGAEGVDLKAGLIEARWEYISAPGTSIGSGLGISRLNEGKGKEKDVSDPFADESLTSPATPTFPGVWTEVDVARKIVSGKYDAKQVVGTSGSDV